MDAGNDNLFTKGDTMRLLRRHGFLACFFVAVCLTGGTAAASELGSVGVYDVVEIDFTGPSYGPTDTPAKDVDFQVTFRHESGSPEYTIHGFWDGDGAGGTSGDTFSVRFCPTATGKWYLQDVASNQSELDGEKEGDYVVAVSSTNHGFWIPDGRWFKRSDGTHQYIVGNTHYDFLSRPNGNEASTTTIRSDIDANAEHFKKLRFCLQSFRSENQSATVLPFFTTAGGQSDREGENGDRPNPRYFTERVDAAVKRALEKDLICDLILGGTIEDQAVDSQTYMKYVAARYGAYPNVWICVGQEWNEQVSASHEVTNGNYLRSLLAYPVPMSTHATSGWNSSLNGSWCTHSIRQGKYSDLSDAANALLADYSANQSKPCVNGRKRIRPRRGLDRGRAGRHPGIVLRRRIRHDRKQDRVESRRVFLGDTRRSGRASPPILPPTISGICPTASTRTWPFGT